MRESWFRPCHASVDGASTSWGFSTKINRQTKNLGGTVRKRYEFLIKKTINAERAKM